MTLLAAAIAVSTAKSAGQGDALSFWQRSFGAKSPPAEMCDGADAARGPLVVLPVGFAKASRETSKTRNLAMIEQLGRQGLTASWVAVDDIPMTFSSEAERKTLKQAKWQSQHASGKARLSLVNFRRALLRCLSPELAWAKLCAVVEDDVYAAITIPPHNMRTSCAHMHMRRHERPQGLYLAVRAYPQ